MIQHLTPSEYGEAERLIDPTQRGAVYPYSVTQGFQSGDVYMHRGAALIWHFSGFAFLCGQPDTETLDAVYNTFLSEHTALPRRFLLFAETPEAIHYFSEQSNLILESRYFYRHSGIIPALPDLPEEYRIAPLDSAVIPKLNGNITPSFSWESTAQFLKNGTGRCVLDGEMPAAWSISAAVSRDELDIGIETDAAYRQRGFAKAAAGAMIEFALSAGKQPVWACHAGNLASQRLACSLGFLQIAECYTVKRKY